MRAPSFQNCAYGLQEGESYAEQRNCYLSQRVCIGLMNKIGKLSRKNGEQNRVDEEHDDVKQDAPICVFKELLDHQSVARMAVLYRRQSRESLGRINDLLFHPFGLSIDQVIEVADLVFC